MTVGPSNKPEPTRCDRCRRPIPADAPGGLCPNCLFSAQLPTNAHTVADGKTCPDDGGVDGMTPPILVDQAFGPYRLMEELGRGGMGVVYRACHEQLDRLVAIKMVLAGTAASPRHLEAFLTEARAVARVRHPHIVGIYEVGQWQGWHFMAMELVDGKSLLEHVRAAPIEIENAVRIVRDVADAMSHLHEHGIVHRDIKPSNILLDREGAPYVTDFGLARVRELATGLTTVGPCEGTPNYMSPEQAAGAPARLAPLTDMYSLGAVLYELLTGRPPFHAETIPETLLQVLRREPEPPRRLRPAIPAALEAICLRCLEKTPSDRYPDMSALSADLDRYLDGEVISATPISAPQRFRRWWRRDPALAARYLSLCLFFGIAQIWDFVGYTTDGLHQTAICLVPPWILLTYLFSRILRENRRKEESVRAAWITVDVICLTGILLNTAGFQQSPLLVLYSSYIVSVGLWNRVRAVWLATVLCILSNLTLWISAPLLQPTRAEPLHVHLVFTAGLIVLAFLVAHQVRQVRVMRRYLRQNQPSLA